MSPAGTSSMSTSPRRPPLVGRLGAGPHDLRRNAETGRMFWEAAPSQWYAEPKRLAGLGYLDAEKLPGRTRERTHYTLTGKGCEALERWEHTAPHRVEVLTVNVDWAKRALRLQLEWPDEVERTPTRRRA